MNRGFSTQLFKTISNFQLFKLLEAMHWQKPTPTESEILQMDAIYERVTIGGWHAFKEDRS